MTTIIKGLQEDHQYMLKLLHQLEQQIRVFNGMQKGKIDLETLLEIVDYIKEYPNIYHHKIEEAMFEKLRQKPLDAPDLALVNRVFDEHVILNALAELLDIKIGECLLNRQRNASLLSTANLFLKQQIRHIKTEHSILFPLCEEHLAEEDWDELEKLSTCIMDSSRDISDYQDNRIPLSRVI